MRKIILTLFLLGITTFAFAQDFLGFEDFKLGMSKNEVEAVGKKYKIEPSFSYYDDLPYYMDVPSKFRKGGAVNFVFTKGKVSKISVFFASKHSDIENIRKEYDEALKQLQKRLGKGEREDNKYVTYWLSDKDIVISFYTTSIGFDITIEQF